MKRQPFFLIGLAAVVSFLLGLVVAGSYPAGGNGSTPLRAPVIDPRPLTVSVVPETPRPANGVGVDFSIVAARLNGAVVNIDAASRGTERPAVPRRLPRDSNDDDS